MDQVKVALAWLQKHHFWVLSLVVVIATLGVWYTSSSSVASQTKAARTKIDGEFSAVGSIQNQPFKPNDDINRKQQIETQKLAADVLREWEDLYRVQKENVLIWPPELGDRFVEAVKDAKFGDSISSKRREEYLNYIKETFPSLVEIVDAELYAEEGGGGQRGGRGGGGEFGGGEYSGAVGDDGEPLETHLVQWLDQGELRARLVPETVPSPIEIWLLQEDLWVYRTLLQAIADTNESTGASRRDRAAVQTIVEMKVGQAAGGGDATGRTLVAPDASESTSAGGYGGEFNGGGYGSELGAEGGGYGGEFSRGGYGGEFGAEGGGGGANALLAGRYIDDTGAPIPDVPEDFKFGREFKRLPVRMTLEMDTRYLAKLMWELANAPLQVEVDQVRFNPEGEGGRASGSSVGSGEVAVFDRQPTKGTVVLQGIVYIFNPPDPSIVQSDDAGAVE
ncbi:hypothetical protein Pla108_31450 [Botrimarina colliarenosi]|uniref:Uncharacterized protein n=1 Tax=Botrimarina colliarenosi TaxID=2528001 RepID=A0A5C6ACS2_9BACT|nr:hypothetical protein [Botrimarina colliarenosi]TWT96063.1 hypothetical protein Pla108_31450 [Botrimarina colliarenosi]